MRTDKELNEIKDFVDNTYSRLGNLLSVDNDKPYDPEHTQLGYCYKYVDEVTKHVNYRIVCAKTGLSFLDFRVLMHEYGHIYLGHLDGVHEQLDSAALNVFENNRGPLADKLNKDLGITDADKLIQRVIDDPSVNHMIHNIAMDMEVNSRVLSKDDVEKMEIDITSILPRTLEERLEKAAESTEDPELKKMIADALNKMSKEAKMKFIIPERYHTKDSLGNEVPFPAGKTYAEYFIMIIRNLDQFVKMLISINNGENGDTSQVTQQQIQQAMQQAAQQMSGKSAAYKQGYQQGMQDGQQMPQGQQGQQGQNQQGQGQEQGQGQGMSKGQGGQQGQGQGQSSSGQGTGSSGQQQAMDDYQQGYQDGLQAAQNGQGQGQGQGSGMQGLDNLLDELGLTDPGQKKGQGRAQKDSGENDYSDQKSRAFEDKDAGMDHNTPSREEADQNRALGHITSSGGIGCSKEDGDGSTPERKINYKVDEVDVAINEVIKNIKNRSIKRDFRKDVMKKYNHGINKTVLSPSITSKVTVSTEPKLVFLIDVSGSMDTRLIDRILLSISKDLKKINRGFKYDIIAWNTRLAKHIKDVKVTENLPSIPCGGGTDMALGIKYFKDNYGKDAVLILVSDFEDNLNEWHKQEQLMSGYSIYGWNYGSYSRTDKVNWTNFKQRNFSDYGYVD